MSVYLERGWSSRSLNDISLCRSVDYPNCLLNGEGERQLETLVILMKQDYKKTRAVLKLWLSGKGPPPPLQLLCRLNEEGFLFVTTYFYILPNRLDHLYEAFVSVYSKSSVYSNQKTSAAALEVSCTIAQVVNTLMTRDEKVRVFFEGVANKIVEIAVKLIAEGEMQGCYLVDLLNNNYIFQQCLPNFLLHNLRHYLAYPATETHPNAILGTHTKKWSIENSNVGTTFCISKMLNVLPPETIISELKAAADLQPIRWEHMLCVMSVLVTEKNESVSLLKEVIEGWLNAGLEEDKRTLLYLALISVRHCSAERTSQFPNYITWFGDVCRTRISSHFTALFKFLADLVPYEPPVYLKIHLNKVPAAPSGCQSVLTDYISLAKTRLADLNESTNYLSIFNKCHDTEKENLESDVSQLIAHFVATNEIATPVLEAVVFRKKYFEKVFLVHLLSVSAKNDHTRAQVIRKLNSLGKIPPSMFDDWQSM